MKLLTFVLVPTVLASLVQAQQIAPVLDCVELHNDSNQLSIVAHWGYINTGSGNVTIPPGSGNAFTPFPGFQGQPITFEPNYHHSVFTTTFSLAVTHTQTWTLGITGVTASNDPTKYCTGACWDTNQNGVCDPSEDVNGDGTCNVQDCQGRQGLTGATGPQGEQGATGAQGSQGPPGLSPTVRTVSVASTTATATASCNANEVLLNGGGVCAVPNTNSISGRLASSAPSGANGWTVSCSTGQASAVALCAATK